MRSGYENTWDEFLVKVSHYGGNQRRALIAEAETFGQLSLLEAATREWRKRASAADAAARSPKPRRLVRTGPLCSYAEASALACLPRPHVEHPEGTGQRMWNRSSRANHYFAALDAGQYRGRTIERIITREADPARRWVLSHPYGPPVDRERINALLADLRYMRNGRYDVLPADAVVSPTPRLLTQIAMLLAS